jgi:TnsA endonuclease N terminal
MSKYSQGFFIPKNPQKLIGNASPFARSSWELLMMQFLDNHPNVIQWASESIKIPYENPLTGKKSQYVPDFLVMYQDSHGKRRAELVEVKPRKEAMLEHAKSKRDKAFLLVNSVKWAAAMVFCKKNGLTFRVIDETNLFKQKGKSK